MLTHHFVMCNKGMLEYQSLSISEFVYGYVEMVKLYLQIQEYLYAHLQLLMEKAMTYYWESVKDFHLACTFLLHTLTLGMNLVTCQSLYLNLKLTNALLYFTLLSCELHCSSQFSFLSFFLSESLRSLQQQN